MRINSGTKVWPKLPFADTRFNFPPTSRTRRGKRLGLIQGCMNVTAVKAPFFYAAKHVLSFDPKRLFMLMIKLIGVPLLHDVSKHVCS